MLRCIDANRASWIVLCARPAVRRAFAHTVREGPRRGSSTSWRDYWKPAPGIPEPDTDFHDVRGARAGEAVAARGRVGGTDVDEAAEMMINLFWRTEGCARR